MFHFKDDDESDCDDDENEEDDIEDETPEVESEKSIGDANVENDHLNVDTLNVDHQENVVDKVSSAKNSFEK